MCFGSLIRPDIDAYINYTHVPFEWDQEPDAIGYNLQVSTQVTFNNLKSKDALAYSRFLEKFTAAKNQVASWGRGTYFK